jgi:hypothetical protein
MCVVAYPLNFFIALAFAQNLLRKLFGPGWGVCVVDLWAEVVVAETFG